MESIKSLYSLMKIAFYVLVELESNFGLSCQDLQSNLTNSTHPNTLKGIWFW